jgi:hypothetical protein
MNQSFVDENREVACASQECGEGAGETMSPAGGGRHRANNVA